MVYDQYTETTTTHETGDKQMTPEQIKKIASDYMKASRWAQTETATLRIVGIGRKSVRLMHGNGRVET
jgi:hypothetical protein